MYVVQRNALVYKRIISQEGQTQEGRVCVYARVHTHAHAGEEGGTCIIQWLPLSPQQMLLELRAKGWVAVNQAKRQEERGPTREYHVTCMPHWNADVANPWNYLHVHPKELFVLPGFFSLCNKVHDAESHLSVIQSCHGLNHIPPEDKSLSWSFKMDFLFTLKKVHLAKPVLSWLGIYVTCCNMKALSFSSS